jgi:hypothetical protein
MYGTVAVAPVEQLVLAVGQPCVMHPFLGSCLLTVDMFMSMAGNRGQVMPGFRRV